MKIKLSNKPTQEEIEELFFRNLLEIEQFKERFSDCLEDWKFYDKPIYVNDFEFEKVYDYGGEDQGSEYYFIIKITSPDKTVTFWRVDGWYASHVGAEIENVWEVTPEEKTIIVYERKPI